MKWINKSLSFFLLYGISLFYGKCLAQYDKKIQVVLENTTTLDADRGGRLPLIFWPLIDPGDLDEQEAEKLVEALDSRGVALMAAWKRQNPGECLDRALAIGRAQKKCGVEICINAIDLLNSFYNGDERTAHIDDKGNSFWDDSFGSKKDMGCPFTLEYRKQDIREGIEYYLDAYLANDLTVDLIFVDWEVDGPLEVNRAFSASMRCRRCRDYLGQIKDFEVFQEQMRRMRAYLQYYTLTYPVLSRFPDALVGNYAVYPNDGYRYWYDYFEYYVEGQPYLKDQAAKYRKWYNDFALTGYTFAMPVAYTWSRIFNWYDYENTDYRWFYNMLLVASNAGKNTTANIPVITWVHRNTIFFPGKPDTSTVQMSKNCYKELLWHMLLRGTDTFAMWCSPEENADEVRIPQEVYAEAQQYGDFLDDGWPINFNVPSEPGTIISGLILDDRVLVRRTDFTGNNQPSFITTGTTRISVPYSPGKCQIIYLKN